MVKWEASGDEERRYEDGGGEEESYREWILGSEG